MNGPIYISGPMTGYDNGNHPAFAAAAQYLRACGFEVLSPHEVKLADPTWVNYMRADIALVVRAQTVVTLAGWECSRGARLEVLIAHTLGIPVLPLSIIQK